MTLFEPVSPSWEGMVKLADGRERFVKRFGAGGETVIGIHDGPGGDHRLWEPLAALAGDGLQVVLYDQFGGGRSDRPGDGYEWSVEEFVDEVGQLAAALELDRVHLVGQWWGSLLALECALREPQLVRSLTLCNGMARAQTLIAGCEAMIASKPSAVREAVLADVELDPEDESEVHRGLLAINAVHIRRCHPFDLDRSCREFVAEVLPLLADFGPAYAELWGRNDFVATGPIKDWDATARLGEVAVPALVVSGAHDAVSLECGRELVEGLPDAQWLILGQSSHFLQFEAEAEAMLAAIGGTVAGAKG